MIRFRKVNILLLFFLVVYWSLIICTTIFFVKLSVAMFFFLISDNSLRFDWSIEFTSASIKGTSAGTILAIGIWLKAKLQEKKAKK